MNTIHPFLLCINPVVPCVYILFYHALFLACGAWILSYRLSCKKKCFRYCIYIYLFMSYRVSLCGIYLNYNSTEYQAYLPLVINMYSIKYSWLFSHLVNEIVFSCFNMIHTAYLMLFPSDVENYNFVMLWYWVCDIQVVLSMWYPSVSDSSFLLVLNIAVTALFSVELAMIMDRLYGGVCYAGIDTDPELKYPKGAGRVAFSNQQSYIAAISARFVQLQHGEIDKRVCITDGNNRAWASLREQGLKSWLKISKHWY